MTAPSSKSSFGSCGSRCRHASNRYSYRMYFGLNGVSRVRYDNERGKGDHRHIGSEEFEYTFTSLEKLLEDFKADVERWE